MMRKRTFTLEPPPFGLIFLMAVTVANSASQTGMKRMRGIFQARAGYVILSSCAAALIAACSIFAGRTQAADSPAAKQPVLVELFTSEGCSSCPPADALLELLDHEQPVPGARVVVLSEHVDYWDHEGWRDPFSSPEITARQDFYVSRFSQDSAYTPEAVIDGARGLTGNDRRGLVSAIQEAAQKPKIEIAIANATVNGKSVEATVTAGTHPRTDLYAVLADDHDESSVSRGENSGKHLEHVAVVRVIEKIGSLNDELSKQIHVALPGHAQAKMRLVVFAQERGTGHILGVAEAIFSDTGGLPQQQAQSSRPQ
jgi:hypothetical protein